MLGVPAARVVATDDPARRYGGHPWHLLTVHDPDDPATTYRFVAESGLGGFYLLLDECPDCCAPEVPMATVSGLADLGRYLAANPARPARRRRPRRRGRPPGPARGVLRRPRTPPGLRDRPTTPVTYQRA
ncbi:hypothetical protein [Pseudonocardia nigra]|uniref:hypothetical protein n=1 Tax=Pseudonocardia nigra TaxID=1921578 RepID=UPI001C5FA364|nr:hypothetical protein [Pseudonocardia nigra]